jgi:predicted neutral ceramidase superfamily lipid hydrolase
MKSMQVSDDELATFLRAAKERGILDDSLVGMLRHNGWSERRIYRALSEHYAGVLGVAVPRRAQSTENARDAFLYLLNFIALGFWTVALWQIWDHLVNRWLPDALSNSGAYLRDEIAWQVALILVSFPVFVVVHSAGRRWLTYLALVLTAIPMLIDAAYTVQQLIVGDLTIHFFLDTLGLMVIGGGIFAYYLLTIDPPKQTS